MSDGSEVAAAQKSRMQARTRQGDSWASLEAGGDASPVLELVEGSLDDVAFAVQVGIEVQWS